MAADEADPSEMCDPDTGLIPAGLPASVEVWTVWERAGGETAFRERGHGASIVSGEQENWECIIRV